MTFLLSAIVAIISLAFSIFGCAFAWIYLSIAIGGLLGPIIGFLSGMFVFGSSLIAGYYLIKHINR